MTMSRVLSALCAVLLLSAASANSQTEPNYSKFQSNYFFICPQPAACMGAFEKMLSAPEIADKNFEVTLYAPGHNGWDESTHMVSFYFKSAERYLKAGQTFAASPAFQEFMEAGAAVGVENQAQTLTTHSIVAGDGRGTRSMVNWTVKVSDPATFVPAWQKFTKASESYPWASKAYGLQTLLLGNQGWATHQIWASFDTPVEALTFLENFYQTTEFQAYSKETEGAVSLVRSYIANTMFEANPD